MIAATHPPDAASRPARITRGLAMTALIVAALCALAELLAGPGYRIGALPLGIAIQIVRWAATVALGAAVVALLTLLLSLTRSGLRTARGRAAIALALAIAAAAPPLYLYTQLQQLPKIHDITTDLDDPPAFEAVLPLRMGARNAVDYRPSTAAEQRKGYPDITPLLLPQAPPQAFERAVRVAHAMGWDVVASTPERLRIEATDTTLLFGFKDDIVVRITPRAGGSVVDVRSLSRVGGSDFGTNARRVRAYLERLRAEASA